MVPAVVPQNAGSPAKSLPLANFVFIPPPDTNKNSILWRAGETKNLAGAGRYTTQTAGYFLHGRGQIPPPDPSIRHAEQESMKKMKNGGILLLYLIYV